MREVELRRCHANTPTMLQDSTPSNRYHHSNSDAMRKSLCYDDSDVTMSTSFSLANSSHDAILGSANITPLSKNNDYAKDVLVFQTPSHIMVDDDTQTDAFCSTNDYVLVQTRRCKLDNMISCSEHGESEGKIANSSLCTIETADSKGLYLNGDTPERTAIEHEGAPTAVSQTFTRDSSDVTTNSCHKEDVTKLSTCDTGDVTDNKEAESRKPYNTGRISGRARSEGSCNVTMPTPSTSQSVRTRRIASDITGCGSEGTNRSMYEGPLSTRRDLVGRIDAGPLLDYLNRHGVIDQSTVESLNSEADSTTVNTSLLEHVENQGRNGVGLLVNALRQAGQHQVASLLDDEEQRIKTLSGSGYLTSSRHKGQISLTIKVNAIKLPQGVLPGWKRSKGMGQKMWLSLDDIQLQICNTGSRFESDTRLASKVQELEIAEPESDNRRSGCCSCFRRLFSKSRRKKPAAKRRPPPGDTESTGSNSQHVNLESGYASTDSEHRDHISIESPRRTVIQSPRLTGDQPEDESPKHTGSPGNRDRSEFSHLGRAKEVSLSRTASERCATRNYIEGGTPIPDILVRGNKLQHRVSDYIPSSMKVTHYSDIQEKLERLKAAADVFRAKSDEYYNAMKEPASLPFTRMLKYFEQDRSILVLETHQDEGLVIVTICMKRDQLDQLERDLDNGKLTKDIENCTVTDEMLRRVEAEGMKLQIYAEREEVLQARQELT